MRVAYWVAFALFITLLPSDAHAIDVEADASMGKGGQGQDKKTEEPHVPNVNKNRYEHITDDDDVKVFKKSKSLYSSSEEP